MEALAEYQRADDVRHGVADQRGWVHAGAGAALLVLPQQLGLDGEQAALDARLQTQLAQAEVTQRGVAELTLHPPHWAVWGKDYS